MKAVEEGLGPVQSRPRLRRAEALRNSAWGLVDQAIVSLGNFCTTLLLIRTLPPDEFGVYALILNAAIFLNTMQQSVIGYPLCVRGAQSNTRHFRDLVASAMGATGALSLLNSLILFGVCVGMERPALAVPLALAVLLWQLQDTLRGAFQSQLRQREAVPGDSISYLGQAAVIGMLCRAHHVSVPLAWSVVGGTSLLGLLVQLWQLRLQRPSVASMTTMFRDCWSLGRWAVPARIMGFFTLQAFPWAIALRHGTSQVATYQALFQIIALANPVLLSMGSLITASFARTRGDSPREGYRYILLTAVFTGAYLLLVGTAGPQVLSLLYGSHGRYVAFGSELRTLAMAWSFEVVALISTSVLGGMERARGLFWVQSSGFMAAGLIALPMVYRQGLAAAAVGLLLVNVTRAVCGVALALYALRYSWSVKQTFVPGAEEQAG
ncbi:oligosaccharide flippase family protein [Terriglobus roseus]|uniref:Membrane protein involved in the export of O-antigen and teichoic acid n=1 Tax=Terriglobus roseus TaxID=392734 RepID=A0A1H4IZJ4_9BACT|nr:oligosaccharide flippase family protein [Terriglobus roseus]SEB39235.1 Membrane protein involved in the export of O-antigen and teichoic acid [Terriglobus roseus]